MRTVAIFGVGLIGGSFALAIRKAGFSGRIIGVSSPGTINRALELGVIDAGLPPQKAATEADLIYLSQPILLIADSLAELNHWVRPEALITDAGSTKTVIADRAATAISRCQFLGGHPMAGREKRGVDAAEADLFQGRPYVLTPRADAELHTPMARELTGWIQKIGASTIVLSPEEHDRVVAFSSHLPQLASTALAAMLAGRKDSKSGVFGPALTDSTRLALSSFDIWGDILATNKDAIREALREYIATLQEFSQVLETGTMRNHFERGARFAAQLREPS
jgi:prephenate dehydrogenase